MAAAGLIVAAGIPVVVRIMAVAGIVAAAGIMAVAGIVVAAHIMVMADIMVMAGIMVTADIMAVYFSADHFFGRRIITPPPTMLIRTITPITRLLSQCNPRHLSTLNRATRRQHQQNSYRRIGGTTALIRRCTTHM